MIRVSHVQWKRDPKCGSDSLFAVNRGRLTKLPGHVVSALKSQGYAVLLTSCLCLAIDFARKKKIKKVALILKDLYYDILEYRLSWYAKLLFFNILQDPCQNIENTVNPSKALRRKDLGSHPLSADSVPNALQLSKIKAGTSTGPVRCVP